MSCSDSPEASEPSSANSMPYFTPEGSVSATEAESAFTVSQIQKTSLQTCAWDPSATFSNVIKVMTCNYCKWQGKLDQQWMLEHLMGCAEYARSQNICRTRHELFSYLLEQPPFDASIEEMEFMFTEQFDLIQQERFQHVQRMRGLLQADWFLFWQQFQTWRQTVKAKIAQLCGAGRVDDAQQLATKFLYGGFQYQNLDLMYKVPLGTERIRITGMRLDKATANPLLIDEDVLDAGQAEVPVAHPRETREDNVADLRREHEAAISELERQHATALANQLAESQAALRAAEDRYRKEVSSLKAQNCTAPANAPKVLQIEDLQVPYRTQLETQVKTIELAYGGRLMAAREELKAAREEPNAAREELKTARKELKTAREQLKAARKEHHRASQESSEHATRCQEADRQWTKHHTTSLERLRAEYQLSLTRLTAENMALKEHVAETTAESQSLKEITTSQLSRLRDRLRQADHQLAVLRDQNSGLNVLLSREVETERLKAREAEIQAQQQREFAMKVEADARAERKKARGSWRKEMADARAEYTASITAQVTAQAAGFQSQIREAKAELQAQLGRSQALHKDLSGSYARACADLAHAQHENSTLKCQITETRLNLEGEIAAMKEDLAGLIEENGALRLRFQTADVGSDRDEDMESHSSFSSWSGFSSCTAPEGDLC